ncbi:response regulator [Paraglaciecola aestuariivivens]
MSKLAATIMHKRSMVYLALGFTFCYALVVSLGWLATSSAMMQFGTAGQTMLFTSALGFLGLSSAALSYLRDKNSLAIGLSTATFLLAGLNLAELTFTLGFSIDQLIAGLQSSAVTMPATEASLLINLIFILSTVCIFWLANQNGQKQELTAVAGIICLVFAFSVVSLLAYLFQSETAQSLGPIVYLPFPTAIGFLGFSLGMICLLILRIQQNQHGLYYIPLLIGMLFLTITLLFTNVLNEKFSTNTDPIVELKRELVHNHARLSWNNELLKLATHVKQAKQASSIQYTNYQLPIFFRALYVEGKNTLNIVLAQADDLLKTTPTLAYHDFYPAINNPTAEALGIESTPLFLVGDRQQFLIRMPLSSVVLEQTQQETAVLVRVDLGLFLDNVVKSKLAAQDIVRFAPAGDELHHFDDLLVLPFYIESGSVLLEFNVKPLIESHNQLVLVVFCFGTILTFAIAFAAYYAQRSNMQSQKLLHQANARNQYEAELQQSHMSLKLAADIANLGIWRWDVQTGQLTWNDKMYEIYQTPEEVKQNGLIYEYWYESLHEDDRERVTSKLQLAIDNGKNWEDEFRLHLPDGKIKYIKATARSFTDTKTGQVVMIGGNFDISKERELQQELEQKSKQAQNSIVAKSRFLVNISHELRTPMNGILGIGDLFSATNLNVKQRQYLSVMQSSAEKLLALLNDILDLSKIEAGEMHIEMICVPLEEVVGDALKSMSTNAHQKGLDYHYHKHQDVPDWVFTDPVRLRQILTNIVSNAIKFTEQGSITVSINLAQKRLSKHDSTLIEFQIRDTGIGLTKEEMKSLFNPFAQQDQNITKLYGGAGLGLSIVKQLLELLDGSIKVESEPYKGTTVNFILPVKVGSRADGNANSNQDYDFYLQNQHSGLDSKSCLVVDSNEINRKWLKDMLHSWQCNATVCQDATEAQSAWEHSLDSGFHFDLIIIDRQLNGLDAFEFVRAIKQQCESKILECPAIIFVLTTNNLDADLSICEELDIGLQIIKPIKQSEVFNAMMTALGKKQAEINTTSGIQKIDGANRLKVLLAEDHPVNQLLVEEILRARGHKLTTVENGRLAVEAIKNENFDAVLMDVQMPVMDGITATKLIRKAPENSDICIIGLTAKALKEDRNICLEAGMNYYLTKPIKPKALLSVLENKQIRESRKMSLAAISILDDASGAELHAYTLLDIERSLLTTGEDLDLLKRMLLLTLENTQPILDDIFHCESQQDWLKLAKVIHKGKGMLANFCELSFMKSMEELIDEAEHKNVEEIEKQLPVIVEKIIQFTAELKDFIAKTQQGKPLK